MISAQFIGLGEAADADIHGRRRKLGIGVPNKQNLDNLI